jgi:MFS family permease
MSGTAEKIENILMAFTVWDSKRSMWKNMNTFHFKLVALLAFTVFCYRITIATMGMYSICAAAALGLSDAAIYWLTVAVYIGEVIGCIIVGILSDVFGRRPVLLAGGIVFGIGSLVTATSTSYLLLWLAQFFNGFCLAIQAVAINLVIEYMAPEERGFAVISMASIYNLGNVFGVFLLWLGEYTEGSTGIDKWRNTSIFNACAMLVSFPVLYMLALESPHWLLSQGKEKEAFQLLAHVAKMSDVDYESAAAAAGGGGNSSESSLLLERSDSDDKSDDMRAPGAGGSSSSTSILSGDAATAPGSWDEVQSNLDKVWRRVLVIMTDVSRVSVNVALLCFWFFGGCLYYGLMLTITNLYAETTDDDDSDCSFDYTFYFLFFACGFLGALSTLALLPYFKRFQIAVWVTVAAIVCTAAMAIMLGAQGETAASKSVLFVLFFSITKMGQEVTGELKWVVTPPVFDSESRGTMTATLSALYRVGGIAIAILADSTAAYWVDYTIITFLTVIMLGTFFYIPMDSSKLVH